VPKKSDFWDLTRISQTVPNAQEIRFLGKIGERSSGPVHRWREIAFGGPVYRWREIALSGPVYRRREIALKGPFSTTEIANANLGLNLI
jgi:hypothetical protein